MTVATALLAGWPLAAADDEPAQASTGSRDWPPARTLVWAKPGESGTALEPRNWTEYVSGADYATGKGGKPATAPPDEHTDLVIPDAPDGQPYIVGYMTVIQYPKPIWPTALSCRHLAIGAGAALDGGMGVARGKISYSNWLSHDRAAAVSGNIAVRDGGYIYGHLSLVGDRDTTFSLGRSPEPLIHSLHVRKDSGASVTFSASEFDLVAGVTVESGRLVLASGTSLRLHAGAQARLDRQKLRLIRVAPMGPYLWVREQGTLQMQPGARIGLARPSAEAAPDVRIEGLLQIGAPGDGDGSPAVIELTMAGGDGAYLNQPGGLYVQPTAEIRNFGRLSITASGGDVATADKGISIFLEKPVDFGKVSIDHLRVGGIASTDPEAAKQALAAAKFGPHCATDGEALYSRIEFIHFAGGVGTVEFVDGLKTDCEILYPLGDRLIVRSKGNRISQSFDLRSIRALTVADKKTEYNPPRSLTAAEQRFREVNALWADVPGPGQIGNYGKQDWPKVPLMVWRRPGQAGARFVPSNWLDETGRPYFELPVAMMGESSNDIYGLPGSNDADILLPAAGTFYQVVGDRPQWPIRHLTVGDNAFFSLTYNIGGNLWMKDGGGMHAPWFGAYRNSAPVHRFLRFDGDRIRPPGRGENEPQRERYLSVSQWGSYVTGPDGTLELIGVNQVNDQFSIGGEGKLIISENSYLAPGARACFAITPGATVVLLQDASISLEATAKQDGKASVWVGGTLMIGTPERPVTRDMLFPVSGLEEDKIIREPSGNIRTPGVSLLVGEGGRLVMHSADPAKARLVFKMHDSERARENGKRWGDPRGIVLAFLGEAKLDGVVFDNVLEGGIMVSPEQRAAWKHVFYGEHNLVEPARLFWDPDEQ